MTIRRRLAAVVLATAIPMTALSTTGIARAVNIGNEGCTPGYWKNHTGNWEEYRTTSKLRWVFTETAGTRFAHMTLLQALSLRGGKGVDGATQILLRAAAAAVLNAAHEGIGYPYRRFNEPFRIVAAVNEAIDSGDRSQMLELARTLDEANNLGCPL